jgi:hypothetical protein
VALSFVVGDSLTQRGPAGCATMNALSGSADNGSTAGAPPVAPYVRLSPPGETARSLSPTATLRALSNRCPLSTWLRKRTGEPPTGSCLTGHLTSEFSESEKTVRRKQRVRRRARRRSKAATSSALESRASTSQDPGRLRSWWANKRYQRHRATFGVSDILGCSYVKLHEVTTHQMVGHLISRCR